MPENYKAFTRRYRPLSFDDIVSQEHVSSTLKNAIEQNRLSHAYMFCGPRGVGKTTMARVLARTINDIDNKVDGEALGNTLNIIEIDAASNNKVEDIHRIRETVRIPPQNGRYKIYIIDEVHMLSKQAYNALLKTLEEPPAHVIFIFATTEPQKVLPTIMSRCQRFDFRRIKVEEIVVRLKNICDREQISIDNESLHVIAHKADGALRDALSILDQTIAFCGNDIKHDDLLRALNIVSTDRLFLLTDAIRNHDSNAGLELIDELLQEGHDIQEFLVSLTEHFRNLFIARGGKNLNLIESSEDTKARYGEYSNYFSEDDLMRMLHISNEAQFKIRDAHQPRIQLEIAILKLITMERTDGLQQLLKEIAELKAQLANGNSTPAKSVTTKATNPTVSSAPPPKTNAQTSTPQQTQQAAATKSPKTNLFGTPSIRRENSLKSSGFNLNRGALSTEAHPSQSDDNQMAYETGISGNLALAPRSENIPVEDESVTNSSSPVYFHEIREVWPKFLSAVEEENAIDEVITLALKQAVPADLQSNELILECHDAFTFKIMDENRRKLGRILRNLIPKHVIITCSLNKSKDDPESYDPYSRFKKLQEKDPVLRTIIELFGAELEY